MAYTKEQRAAKAAEQEQRAAKPDAEEVLMEKDGQVTEVRNNESVQIMQALGWVLKD